MASFLEAVGRVGWKAMPLRAESVPMLFNFAWSTFRGRSAAVWMGLALACSAAAGLCSTTQFADAGPVIVDDGSDPTGMLCGR